MTETATPAARQLYPQDRLDAMSDDQLRAVRDFASADLARGNDTCVYEGMTRRETVRTALRSWGAVTGELRRRSRAAKRARR